MVDCFSHHNFVIIDESCKNVEVLMAFVEHNTAEVDYSSLVIGHLIAMVCCSDCRYLERTIFGYETMKKDILIGFVLQC